MLDASAVPQRLPYQILAFAELRVCEMETFHASISTRSNCDGLHWSTSRSQEPDQRKSCNDLRTLGPGQKRWPS